MTYLDDPSIDDLLGPEPDASAADQIVNTATLGEWLDLSAVRIAALGREGVLPRQGDREYPLRASVRAYATWVRKNPAGRRVADSDLANEKRRLTKAQADRAETQAALASGELVRAADVEAAWANILTDLRSALLAMPARVSTDLGLDRATTAALDSEIRNALESIANGK